MFIQLRDLTLKKRLNEGILPSYMKLSKGFAKAFALSLTLLCAFLLFPPRIWACPNSPDDLDIIEYFNEIEFSENIYIIIADGGTEFNLMLSCPPRETPTFPPPNFNLQMSTEDNSQSMACNTGSITINKNQLSSFSLGYCMNGSICTFLITLNNSETDTIYSQTLLDMTMMTGNQTYIPNLNPATLPLCPSNFNPCLLSDTCPLSPDKEGDLELCESSTSCISPSLPNNQSYDYNENVYFQTNPTNTSPP